tara:strand:+ start:5977 stop:7344 length:1368 start_codon:yes stop_codon:yes gene_type:complete
MNQRDQTKKRRVRITEKKKKSGGKKDACYHKVKARYDVWPSAYASGALSKCRKVGAANWGNKSKKNEEVTPEEEEDLKDISKQLDKSVKSHAKQSKTIKKALKSEAKRKKAGTESSKESSLRDWFGRKGAKGKKGGWVDCNAPDGKGGYKACGRSSGEKRSKYPSCRPTPGACKEKGKGKSWGKKAAKGKKNESLELTLEQVERIIDEEIAALDEKKKKPCKKAKGKRYVKRVNGRCRSFGQAGKAKGGGDRIRPGTKKGDAYCARSAKIKKCKNPPCANDLSRKKWKCRGSKSMKENKSRKKIKLITEGMKETNDFIKNLSIMGFYRDSTEYHKKNIDTTMIHALKKQFQKNECYVKIVLIGPNNPGGWLYLSEIYVPPECRNKGYARKAMQMILNAADAYGVRIELSSYPADDATTKAGLHDFYTSLDFEPSGDKREMEYHRDFDHSRKFKKY